MSSEALRIATVEAPGNVDPPRGPMAPPMMMSCTDVARELAVSVKTIRRLDASGRLPRPVRVGHAVRWPRAAIEAWLAAGCPPREEWEKFYAAPAARGRRR